MEKFLRQYELKIERFNGQPDSSGRIVATAPTSYLTTPKDLTLELTIQRQALGTSQTGTFRIFNLSEQSRESIFKDSFNTVDARGLQLRAGYLGSPLALIFSGTIQSCQSFRESGSNNNITEVQAFDGGYAISNSQSAKEFPANTSNADKIKALAADLPNVQNTIIGNFPNLSPRAETINGSTWKAIMELSDNKAFIDQGTLVVLNDKEVVNFGITLDKGNILGTPRRSETLVEVDVIFEPRVAVGTFVDLNSSTNKWLNGRWKVYSVRHSGVISPAVAGELITTITLWNGGQDLQYINGSRMTGIQ